MKNNLDKLFKSKLEGQEPEFHPAAWDEMEELLIAEGMSPKQERKKNRKGVIIPIFLLALLITIVGYTKLNRLETTGEGSTLSKSIKNIETNGLHENFEQSTEVKTQRSDTKPKTQVVNKKITPDKSTTFSHSQTDNFTELDKSNSTLTQYPTTNNTTLNFQSEDFVSSSNNSGQVNHERFESKENIQENQTILNIEEGDKMPIDANESFKFATLQKTVNSDLSGVIGEELIADGSVQERDELDKPVSETRFVIDMVSMIENKFVDLEHQRIQLEKPIQIRSKSPIYVGVLLATRYNNGLSYAVGPYLEYRIGNGFGLSLGAQLDGYNLDSGPEISVFDKKYSFGSTITERKFSMTNQYSIRAPFSISKRFDRISLYTSIIAYRPLATVGDVANLLDGEVGNNMRIDNELIKPLTFGFQFGGTLAINRYFHVDLSLEYRQAPISEAINVSKTKNTVLPTLGLRYKMFNY